MNERCVLVRDLLPLYADDLVSEESAEIIRLHLGECQICRQEYEIMTKEIVETETSLPRAKKPFLKIKKFYVRRTLLASLAILILAFPTWLSINELRGEGITFDSVSSVFQSREVFRSIGAGEFAQARKSFDDSERTTKFLQALENLEQQGVTLRAGLPLSESFSASQGAVFGTVRLDIVDGDMYYYLYLVVGYKKGHFTPLGFMPRVYGVAKIEENLHRRDLLPQKYWPGWLLELDDILAPLLVPFHET